MKETTPKMNLDPMIVNGPVTTKEELDQVIEDNPNMVLILLDGDSDPQILPYSQTFIYQHNVLCLEINANKYPGIADHILKVETLPTACSFIKGKVLQTVSGPDYGAIVRLMESIKAFRSFYDRKNGIHVYE